MSFSQAVHGECAFDATYTKALQLVQSGGVVSCESSAGSIEGAVRLAGTVRASSGAPYQANVSLDLADQDVLGYGCTCPASYNYSGMCKHAAALALWYVDSIGAENLGLAHGAAKAQAARERTAPRPTKKPALPSSPQMTSLFNAIASRQLEEAASAQQARAARRATPSEPVDLQVTISAQRSYYAGDAATWLLKLKVCRGKAGYIAKNINALVNAYKTGAEFSYGKNLSFAHLPGAFTPRARALMKLVTRIATSQQALFLSREKYWYAGAGTDIKELPLSDADAIEVLDALDGGSFAFQPGYDDRYAILPARTLAIASGDPLIEARVEEHAAHGPDGLDLHLPTALNCLYAGQRLYLLDDKTAWRCSDDFAAKYGPLFSALLPATRAIHIGAADLGAFCRDVLPLLQAATKLDAPATLEALLPPRPEFSFAIGLENGEVFCRTTVTYGKVGLSLYDPEAAGQPARDLALEYRAQSTIEAYFPNGTAVPWFEEDDTELLYLLLTEGLRELSGLGEVLLSERLRAVEVRESPQVRVKAAIRSGLLDLEVSASNLSPRDLEAYLASFKRKQRFVRLSNGDIMQLDDSMRALTDLADGLGVETADLAGGVVGLPSNRTLFVDALLKQAQGIRLDRNPGFRAIVRDFDSFGDADFEVPASLTDVLRPYQVDGFRWLQTLERFGFGGILADDMGLGKTLQVIAHILACKEAGQTKPTLVVCPASLVYNWAAELERFAPQLDVLTVLGGKAARTRAIAAACNHDVLVTSYDLMKRDVEAYTHQHFCRVVLDEAQYIKNPATQVAKCAKCLPADVRFACTGTPIENRLAELWSIFDFLMPGILGGRDTFARRFEGAVENREEAGTRQLQCLVAPFILRRLKRNVLRDLPEKDESVVYACMTGEQEKLYRANQDRLALQIAHELPGEFKKNKLQVLAELTKLRQICCDPRLFYEDFSGDSAKLETCLELVRNAVDGGHRILLFSQFTSMLDILAERLRAEGLGFFTLTGATSKLERARLVDAFQTGDAPVFLISLKAGGVGLNLTAADVVIHYDPWWNLAAQNQATDRAHRIGQTRAVSVFKLIAKGTIEERIIKMQETKRDLAESVLGGDAVASASFSRDDILALLGGQE